MVEQRRGSRADSVQSVPLAARRATIHPAPVLGGVTALLLDLDGVLYVEDEAIPGAPAAIARLRAGGIGLRFVTNTTARPRRAILGRLTALGFDVGPDELLTPAALAVRLVAERGYGRVALLADADVLEDFAGVPHSTDDTVDAVIVGDLGDRFGYEPLNRAFRQVMAGADLVALQRNRFWLTPDGLSLDVGPFVAALEYATGREALVLGKPSRSFFELALADLGVAARDAAMVGDDIESDIGGAQAAGIRGILVRTGKYLEDGVAASGITPTVTVDSIAAVPDLLLARA